MKKILIGLLILALIISIPLYLINRQKSDQSKSDSSVILEESQKDQDPNGADQTQSPSGSASKSAPTSDSITNSIKNLTKSSPQIEVDAALSGLEEL